MYDASTNNNVFFLFGMTDTFLICLKELVIYCGSGIDSLLEDVEFQTACVYFNENLMKVKVLGGSLNLMNSLPNLLSNKLRN